MAMTRDQAIIALAAWQLARPGLRVVRPGPEQVKSFNRVVHGRQQHVRAFQRRPPVAARPLSEVLAEAKDAAEWAREEAAAKAAGHPGGFEDAFMAHRRIMNERFPQHGVQWQLPGGDAFGGLAGGFKGGKVEAFDGRDRVIGTIVAVTGVGDHTHDHAVIESGDTGQRYLVALPGGAVEHAEDLSRIGPALVHDPVAWADRLDRGPAGHPGTVPDTNVPPPDREPGGGWIPPEKWAEGQLEWIKRGEAAWQRNGWSVVYERDDPAHQQFGRLDPRNQMDRPSEEELRDWLVKMAPRPPAPPVPVAPSQFGQGAPEVRRLTAELANLAQASPDKQQPTYGTQATVKVRDLPDGTKVVTKQVAGYSGESIEDLGREELAFYVSQAIGAGVPAVVRLPSSETWEGIAEDFVPGDVGASVLPGNEDYYTALNKMYEKGQLTIGLLDYLIGNLDRNTGNFIVKDDGTLVPIDHGLAFGDEPAGSPFVNLPVLHKMGDAKVDELAGNMAQVRDEFTRLEHPGWYLFVMKNLAALRTRTPSKDPAAAAIWMKALTREEYHDVWNSDNARDPWPSEYPDRAAAGDADWAAVAAHA